MITDRQTKLFVIIVTILLLLLIIVADSTLTDKINETEQKLNRLEVRVERVTADLDQIENKLNYEGGE